MKKPARNAAAYEFVKKLWKKICEGEQFDKSFGIQHYWIQSELDSLGLLEGHMPEGATSDDDELYKIIDSD